MTTGARVMGIAVGLAVTIALGACGSQSQTASSGEEFASGFRRVTVSYQQRTDAVKDAGKGAIGQGPDKVLAVYGSMRDAIHASRVEYQGLQPPASLKPTFDRLVALLAAQEKAVDSVIAAAKANDGPGLTEALAKLSGQFSDWARARTDIEGQITHSS